MDDSELIRYISESKNSNLHRLLENWFASCLRFKDFAYHNRNKIRRKIRSAATAEDLKDTIAELEVAYLLLLDGRFVVEYEKYEAGAIRAPDFYVTFERAIEFNVEVKRIREASLGERYDKWLNEIVSRIQAVPSSFGFSLDMAACDPTGLFMDRLESSKEKIVNYIKDTVLHCEDRLPFDTTAEYSIPGFEGEIDLVLSKPSKQTETDRTAYFGGIDPIFYTEKELYKFGDTIFEKLGQMIPGMINVLIVLSESSTHEREDLLDAIRSINSLLGLQDEAFFVRKGFVDRDDFLSKAKYLSAVLFRSLWVDPSRERNELWCNGQSEQEIPDSIKDYLRVMDKPR